MRRPAPLNFYETVSDPTDDARYGRRGKTCIETYMRDLRYTSVTIDVFVQLVARCDNGCDDETNPLLIDEGTCVLDLEGKPLSQQQVNIIREAARSSAQGILYEKASKESVGSFVDRKLACELRGEEFAHDYNHKRHLEDIGYLFLALNYALQNRELVTFDDKTRSGDLTIARRHMYSNCLFVDGQRFGKAFNNMIAEIPIWKDSNKWYDLNRMMLSAHWERLDIPNLFFEKEISAKRLLYSIKHLQEECTNFFKAESPAYESYYVSAMSELYWTYVSLAKYCVDTQQPTVSFTKATFSIRPPADGRMRDGVMAYLEAFVAKLESADETTGAGAGEASKPDAVVDAMIRQRELLHISTAQAVVDIPPEPGAGSVGLALS
ncbi:MAG: hypothetical protein P1U63_11345 [Coxiellaceae bacterium]|nr:hypothetical protein [Coxiellaceae bacterium]